MIIDLVFDGVSWLIFNKLIFYIAFYVWVCFFLVSLRLLLLLWLQWLHSGSNRWCRNVFICKLFVRSILNYTKNSKIGSTGSMAVHECIAIRKMFFFSFSSGRRFSHLQASSYTANFHLDRILTAFSTNCMNK